MTANMSGQPSYEEARDELIAIVRQLESGAEPLEQSLALWERGEQLAAICQQWLDGARARVEAARERGADREPQAGTDSSDRSE